MKDLYIDMNFLLTDPLINLKSIFLLSLKILEHILHSSLSCIAHGYISFHWSFYASFLLPLIKYVDHVGVANYEP